MNALAILIYGKKDSARDALAEDKYRDLAAAFISQGYDVRSVLYSDEQAAELAPKLLAFNMVLVWVNPIEQGNDRSRLDSLLSDIAAKGCLVSTHPEVILKIGTKDILFKTKHMDWGGDIEMYSSFDDFTRLFPAKLTASKTRILKQYRGNGGNGVFKVKELTGHRAGITHAIAGGEMRTLTWDEFFNEFRAFFSNQGLLIDQAWNDNIHNGMVRCYVCGTKVAGFGYQEINALYELNNTWFPPGKRYYFTENCGLFKDLKEIMETKWIPELQEKLDLPADNMPVIWDADFFINVVNSPSAIGKYTLCEINVSCVSPFPPSAIKFITAEVGRRINKPE
jgi:hypothetical protein